MYWKISPSPVEIGPISGVPTPGRDLLPRLLQPLLDELAREVDAHVVLEDDRDLGEPELRQRPDLLDVRASPAIASSTGRVICRSTSTGDSAGAFVLIWTWTFVTSGMASMGSRSADQIPDADEQTGQRQDQHSLREDEGQEAGQHGTPAQSVRMAVADLRALELALEEKGAGDDHALAGLQTLRHFDDVAVAGAQLHRAPREGRALRQRRLDEDDALAVEGLDGGRRERPLPPARRPTSSPTVTNMPGRSVTPSGRPAAGPFFTSIRTGKRARLLVDGGTDLDDAAREGRALRVPGRERRPACPGESRRRPGRRPPPAPTPRPGRPG